MPGLQSARPLLPPAGHPCINQPGVGRQHRVWPQPEALHHTGAVTLDQNIGAHTQAGGQRHSFGGFQVDHDRAFAPPVNALLMPDLAALWAVHHHHIRAKISQKLPGKRRRADPGKFNDSQPIERTRSSHLKFLYLRFNFTVQAYNTPPRCQSGKPGICPKGR